MRALILGCSLVFFSLPLWAQSNVGELLDKGGKKLTKADYAALVPFRVKYVWPDRGGEGDLVYQGDGTLSGVESHYPSRSDSPTTGVWTADEEGKWCMKKHLTAWDKRTDACWYTFRLGDDFYGSAKDDRDARVAKIRSFAKAP